MWLSVLLCIFFLINMKMISDSKSLNSHLWVISAHIYNIDFKLEFPLSLRDHEKSKTAQKLNNDIEG